jgi:putative oxidoreductase
MGSSADIALLVLRLTLGAMLVTHGVNKLFGPGGRTGTTRWFHSLGFRPAWLHAGIAAGTELGAGVLLAAGLITPLAAAACIGLMTVAAFTDHRGKGFFVFRGGWEYVAVVALAAVSIAIAGPGKWSLDAAVGWQPHGLWWAGLAVIVGLAGALATLILGRFRPAREAGPASQEGPAR